jgi:hypothetical protein
MVRLLLTPLGGEHRRSNMYLLWPLAALYRCRG